MSNQDGIIKHITEQAEKFKRTHYRQNSNIPKEYMNYIWGDKAVNGKKLYDSFFASKNKRVNKATAKTRKNAYNVAKDYSSNILKNTEDGKSLLFIGGQDTGKTVLATLILRDAINLLSKEVLFVSFSEFVLEANTANFREHIDSMAEKYIEPKFLCLDNMNNKTLKTKIQECLEYILTERRYAKNPTIITSKISMSELFNVVGESVFSLLNDPKIYKRVDIRSYDEEGFLGEGGSADILYTGNLFNVEKTMKLLDFYRRKYGVEIDYKNIQKILYESISGK